MSVGFENPISGSYNTSFKSISVKGSLGGGIPGFIPTPVQKVNNNDGYSQIRFSLREAWNTSYPSQLKKNKLKRIITPFRAITNSGDILARKYYSCGGPCQTFQKRPGLFGLRGHFGAIHSNCDGSGVPPATCNIKYVYDSSDYTTYLKNQAVNKNYNDLSYAGNNSNTAQSNVRHARRY
jgi:hypothetical protein